MKSFCILIIYLVTSATIFAQGELQVKSFLQSTHDLTARTVAREDAGGTPCALVKVVFGDQECAFECGNIASMIVGDISFHTNEYWVYLAAGNGGAKHLKVKHPNYAALDVKFSDYGFKTLEPRTTYTLTINKTGGLIFSKLNQFYADVFFQAGDLIGTGISVGTHFHAVNAEFEFTKGILKSDDVFWYNQNNLISQNNYSALSGNIKLGYGFQLGKKFYITPQGGFGLVKCMSDGSNPGKDANAAFALLGCRAGFVFAKHLQVVVAPYYNFAIKKSSSFEELSSIQSSINKWAKGFNVKVGLSIFF